MFDSSTLNDIVTALQTDAAAILLSLFSFSIVVGLAMSILRFGLQGVQRIFADLDWYNETKK